MTCKHGFEWCQGLSSDRIRRPCKECISDLEIEVEKLRWTRYSIAIDYSDVLNRPVDQIIKNAESRWEKTSMSTEKRTESPKGWPVPGGLKEVSLVGEPPDFSAKILQWCDYPIGTIARQSWTGFQWTKTNRGWKADGGSTFAFPGDADEVAYPIDERSDTEAALAEDEQTLKRLVAYVELDCWCPCCQTSRYCLKDCSYSTNDVVGYARMHRARKALWG